MAGIAWSDFSWEALSTLVTGLSAVGAACLVGYRQAGIAERQTRIADQQRAILAAQAELDASRLRGEIFERRFAVYQATAKLISTIMTTGYPIEREVERTFLLMMDQSKFLYRPSVYLDLKEIWSKSCAAEAMKKIMQHNFNTTGDYGGELVEKELQNSLWMNARLDSLSELFGDELNVPTSTTG